MHFLNFKPNELFHVSYDYKYRKTTQSHSADFVQFNICLEGVVLWILAQAILKNIERSIFYRCFTKSPKAYILTNGGLHGTISQEQLDRLSWNFLKTYISKSFTYGKIFNSKYWAVKFLWIIQYEQKSTFSVILMLHNSRLE
jgi:hypothetical protein